jgi:hypothetical protein
MARLLEKVINSHQTPGRNPMKIIGLNQRKRAPHPQSGSPKAPKRLLAIAGIAILCTGLLYGTAIANNGNPTIRREMSDFRNRVEVLVEEMKVELRQATGNIQDDIAAQTVVMQGEHSDIQTDIANQTVTLQDDHAALNELIVSTHLVDPFDVAVDVCTEIGAGADYGATLGLGVAAGLELSGGLDVFGNGVELQLTPGAVIGGSASLGADVGISVTACINGIFARQNEANQEDVAASLSDPEQIDFVHGLLATGQVYRDRVVGSAKGANLYSDSTDKLNESLTIFEQITFADDPNSAVQELLSGGFDTAMGGINSLISEFNIPGIDEFNNGLESMNLNFADGLTPAQICDMFGGTGTPFDSVCSSIPAFEGTITGIKGLSTTVSSISSTVNGIDGVVGDIDSGVGSILSFFGI